MPLYKAEVMKYLNLTSDEYDRRTIEGDESIYQPQANHKFDPTFYSNRVAHVLGLDYQGFIYEVSKGKFEHKISNGFGWHDEDPSEQ